jgi:glycosyltransferase involved in cell wall biosynthesis
MDREPLVSVITPFLNTEKFIQEAIESVLAQTYPHWELLLIDDGSTDSSVQIALSYAQHHPQKVYYLSHRGHANRGASASRNLGISKARGAFIAYLDSDDIWLPQKLENQVPLLIAHPDAAMLYGATEYWYSWTGKAEDQERDYTWSSFGIPYNTPIQPPALLTLFLQNPGTVPCTCSLLVRREAIEQIGGWEEEFRYIYTDQVFYAKMCLQAPVFAVDGCWDRYRQHPDSSVHVVEKTGRSLYARLTYLKWLELYLSEQGFENTEVWLALQTQLHPLSHRPHLERIDPFGTRSDQGFNVQANGASALSVQGKNFTQDTTLFFADTSLPTTYGSPNWLTALVPADLYAQPGVYDIYLKRGATESNRLTFTVDP